MRRNEAGSKTIDDQRCLRPTQAPTAQRSVGDKKIRRMRRSLSENVVIFEPVNRIPIAARTNTAQTARLILRIIGRLSG
jgi:hypothetical protein